MRISDWSSDVCSSDLGEPFRLYDIKLYYPHIGVGFDAPLKIWLKLSILRSAGHQPIATFIVGHPFKQSCFGSFFKAQQQDRPRNRSEEHTSELQSLMRNSYAVFCLKKTQVDTID